MPRTKEEVKQDIVEHLAWDARVNAAEVDVEVRDGTVTLRGTVPSHRARTAAVEDAERIRGVGMLDRLV